MALEIACAIGCVVGCVCVRVRVRACCIAAAAAAPRGHEMTGVRYTVLSSVVLNSFSHPAHSVFVS
jgi:hypothetical protein